MNFPTIRHIDDVLPHVEGRKDFVIAKRDFFTVIDYVIELEDTFDHPIRRECRGIKFRNDTGEIMARPLHKFFNLGQKPEVAEDKINWNKGHEIYEKMDGSMIHPIIDGTFFRFCTRMGITDVALQARRWLDYVEPLQEQHYMLLMQRCEERGLTPIFEWTSPRNQIVVKYGKSMLYLLAIREKITGRYLSFNEMLDITPWMVEFCPMHDASEYSFKEFIQICRDSAYREGLVVRFEDGTSFKLKSDWYVLRHRARSEIGLEKNALTAVFDGAVDDIVPLLEPEDAEALTKYADATNKAIASLANILETMVGHSRKMGKTRKDVALTTIHTLNPMLVGAFWSVYDGKPSIPSVKKVLSKHLSNEAGRERLGSLLGVRWKDFYWNAKELEFA